MTLPPRPLQVTGSLEPAHASETLHALRFGERCSAVVNAGAGLPQHGISSKKMALITSG